MVKIFVVCGFCLFDWLVFVACVCVCTCVCNGFICIVDFKLVVLVLFLLWWFILIFRNVGGKRVIFIYNLVFCCEEVIVVGV